LLRVSAPSSIGTRRKLRKPAGPPNWPEACWRGAVKIIKRGKMYYVYVMYSCEQDKFYIGYTENLERRIYEHGIKSKLSDRRIKNLKLVYYEACLSKVDAVKREKQLKTGFGRGYLRKRLENTIKDIC